MKKSEELGKLIGMTSEGVEREIDKGMWDILIELNKKNYKTPKKVYHCILILQVCPCINSISTTWELDRKANSWTIP